MSSGYGAEHGAFPAARASSAPGQHARELSQGRGLRALCLSHTAVDDGCVAQLGGLTSLDLSGCKNLTDYGILQVLMKSRQLQTLKLSGISSLTPSALGGPLQDATAVPPPTPLLAPTPPNAVPSSSSLLFGACPSTANPHSGTSQPSALQPPHTATASSPSTASPHTSHTAATVGSTAAAAPHHSHHSQHAAGKQQGRLPPHQGTSNMSSTGSGDPSQPASHTARSPLVLRLPPRQGTPSQQSHRQGQQQGNRVSKPSRPSKAAVRDSGPGFVDSGAPWKPGTRTSLPTPAAPAAPAPGAALPPPAAAPPHAAATGTLPAAAVTAAAGAADAALPPVADPLQAAAAATTSQAAAAAVNHPVPAAATSVTEAAVNQAMPAAAATTAQTAARSLSSTAFSGRGPSLTSVKLPKGAATPATLAWLPKGLVPAQASMCTQLQKVEVVGGSSKGVDDCAISQLTGACPCLRTLVIKGAERVSDAGALCTLRHCTALRRLTLTGSPHLSDTTLTAALMHSMRPASSSSSSSARSSSSVSSRGSSGQHAGLCGVSGTGEWCSGNGDAVAGSVGERVPVNGCGDDVCNWGCVVCAGEAATGSLVHLDLSGCSNLQGRPFTELLLGPVSSVSPPLQAHQGQQCHHHHHPAEHQHHQYHFKHHIQHHDQPHHQGPIQQQQQQSANYANSPSLHDLLRVAGACAAAAPPPAAAAAPSHSTPHHTQPQPHTAAAPSTSPGCVGRTPTDPPAYDDPPAPQPLLPQTQLAHIVNALREHHTHTVHPHSPQPNLNQHTSHELHCHSPHPFPLPPQPFSHLRTLRLGQCKRLTESALAAACVVCPHLSSLSVQGVNAATDAVLKVAITANPNLRELDTAVTASRSNVAAPLAS